MKVSSKKFNIHRENSDLISDTETVHIIKTIHLPENSGKPYETRGQRTDFALIELAESANICTQEETARGRCWPVTPVRLPDPSFQIKEGQKVRTLGRFDNSKDFLNMISCLCLGWGATEFSFGDEQSEFLAQLDIYSSTLYNLFIETNIGPNGADPCKAEMQKAKFICNFPTKFFLKSRFRKVFHFLQL